MCFLLKITFQREHKPARGFRQDSEYFRHCSHELNGNINGKGRIDLLSVANTTPESLPMKESNQLELMLKK